MLNFRDLIEKVRRHERKQDRFIESILGLAPKTLDRAVYIADFKKSEDSDLYERLVKWCNYRDVDMTSFFGDPLDEEEKVS